MRRNSDDDENPFDGVFGGIDRMIESMTGDDDHFEVHEYDDRVTVVADVPGIDEAEIDLRCDGRHLAIRAPSETRPLAARVDLPAYVDPGSATTSLNNGVLEITLDRDTDPASIGFQ